MTEYSFAGMSRLRRYLRCTAALGFAVTVPTIILGVTPLVANAEEATTTTCTDTTNQNQSIEMTATHPNLPISGESYTFGKTYIYNEQISVTTCYKLGYTLTVQAATTTDLVDSSTGNKIPATSGTFDAPAALADTEWGIAVADAYGFNNAYIADIADNSTEQTTADIDRDSLLFAAPPTEATTINQTSEPTTDGSSKTDVYYGFKIANTTPAGTYAGSLVYTATVNLPDAAKISTTNAIMPSSYNLNSNVDDQVVITGENLETTNTVYVDTDEDTLQNEDSSEDCTDLTVLSDTAVTCTVPTDSSIEPGTYDVYVETDGGVAKATDAFTYEETIEIIDVSPNYYNLAGDAVVQMVGGQESSMLLTKSGRVFSWGDNSEGQLGVGDTSSRTYPTDITSHFGDGTDKVTMISQLGWHSLALTESGKVYSWGSNDEGEVGNNGTDDVTIPLDITSYLDLAIGDKVVEVYAGWKASYVLTEYGYLYSWGYNDYGQLGIGSSTLIQRTPVKISYTFGGAKIKKFAVDSHILILTDDNKLYAWGRNDAGQVGANYGSKLSNGYYGVALPVEITDKVGVDGEDIAQLATGSNSSLLLTTDGDVYSWGANYYGNLAVGRTGNNITSPTKISSRLFGSSSDPVVELAIGYYTSMVRTESNKIYRFGQYATSSGSSNTPTLVTDLGSETVTKVSASGESLYAITSEGGVYNWLSSSIPTNVADKIDYGRITITGANFSDITAAYIDLDSDGEMDNGEQCTDLRIDSDKEFSCHIPNDADITEGTYDLYVIATDEVTSMPKAIKYYYYSEDV